MTRRLERLTGQVERAPVRAGTGSAHDAVTLRTDDGATVLLQRVGGNPFRDADTDRLVGHTVCVEGYRVGDVFRYVSADVDPSA